MATKLLNRHPPSMTMPEYKKIEALKNRFANYTFCASVRAIERCKTKSAEIIGSERQSFAVNFKRAYDFIVYIENLYKRYGYIMAKVI
jgi:hypothetical protein